ncbi:MAG: type II toxin-antitoxin system Phd/YefM family antitoxin [Gaiellaceae bacterium]
MTRMTATEVARRFSEVLDRVVSGEEIEVTRASVPVAVFGPGRQRLVPAARFRELLASAPPVDDAFADDLRAIRRSVGPPPNPPLL